VAAVGLTSRVDPAGALPRGNWYRAGAGSRLPEERRRRDESNAHSAPRNARGSDSTDGGDAKKSLSPARTCPSVRGIDQDGGPLGGRWRPAGPEPGVANRCSQSGRRWPPPAAHPNTPPTLAGLCPPPAPVSKTGQPASVMTVQSLARPGCRKFLGIHFNDAT
jgi:hypothetical protein